MPRAFAGYQGCPGRKRQCGRPRCRWSRAVRAASTVCCSWGAHTHGRWARGGGALGAMASGGFWFHHALGTPGSVLPQVGSVRGPWRRQSPTCWSWGCCGHREQHSRGRWCAMKWLWELSRHIMPCTQPNAEGGVPRHRKWGGGVLTVIDQCLTHCLPRPLALDFATHRICPR
jgi:hypothetical protein